MGGRDLAEGDFREEGLEIRGRLGVLRDQRLAVAAPGRVELDERVALLRHVREVRWRQDLRGFVSRGTQTLQKHDIVVFRARRVRSMSVRLL